VFAVSCLSFIPPSSLFSFQRILTRLVCFGSGIFGLLHQCRHLRNQQRLQQGSGELPTQVTFAVYGTLFCLFLSFLTTTTVTRILNRWIDSRSNTSFVGLTVAVERSCQPKQTHPCRLLDDGRARRGRSTREMRVLEVQME